MAEKPVEQPTADVTADLNRVLEAARLFFAVITTDELENLRLLLKGEDFQKFEPISRPEEAEKGNTGVRARLMVTILPSISWGNTSSMREPSSESSSRNVRFLAGDSRKGFING